MGVQYSARPPPRAALNSSFDHDGGSLDCSMIQSMMNRPRSIALALVVGGGTLTAIAAARPPPKTPATASTHRQQGRERAEDIRVLLESLPSKTAREKLEDAYDGAVRTHEIGFPKSAVR